MKINISSFFTTIASLSVIGFPLVAGLAEAFNIPSTLLSILMRGIIILCSIVLLLRMQLPNINTSNILFVCISIFWTIYIQRIFYYTIFDFSPTKYELSHYIVWGVGTCFLPMIAIFLARSMTSAKNLFQAFFYICILAMILGIFQAESTTYVDDRIIFLGRLQLDSLNPISLGSLGAVGIILSVWLFIGKINLKPRILHFFLALSGSSFGFYLLLLSGSRGPLVAFLLVIVFIILSANTKVYLKTFLIIFAFFIPLVFVVSTINVDLFSSTANRITNALMGQDMATSTRILSYTGAWGVFVENPVFGGSMEDPITQFYPHNVFLEVLMSTGILGFIPFFVSIGLGLYYAYRLIRTNSDYAWIGSLYALFLFQAQFSGSLYQMHAVWVLLALTALAYFQERRNPVAFSLRSDSKILPTV